MSLPEEIHHMRQMLDMISQGVSMLKPLEVQVPNGDMRIMNSTEIVICIQRIDFSRAWLGKILGGLGEKNPYGDMPMRPHDSGSAPLGWLENESPITRVIEMRKKMRTQLNKLQLIRDRKMTEAGMSTDEQLAWGNALTYMVEAEIALGWELRRIYAEKHNG